MKSVAAEEWYNRYPLKKEKVPPNFSILRVPPKLSIPRVPCKEWKALQLLKKMFLAEGDRFGGRQQGDMMMKVLCEGNYGLFLNKNEIWREQKRFALHALRDQGFISGAMQVMNSENSFVKFRLKEYLFEKNFLQTWTDLQHLVLMCKHFFFKFGKIWNLKVLNYNV